MYFDRVAGDFLARGRIAWPCVVETSASSRFLFFFFSTSTRSRRWLSRSSILFDISPPRSRDDASLTSLSIRECSSAWFDVGLARARMTEIDRASRLRGVLSMESSIELPRDICTWLAIRFEEKSQWGLETDDEFFPARSDLIHHKKNRRKYRLYCWFILCSYYLFVKLFESF